MAMRENTRQLTRPDKKHVAYGRVALGSYLGQTIDHMPNTVPLKIQSQEYRSVASYFVTKSVRREQGAVRPSWIYLSLTVDEPAQTHSTGPTARLTWDNDLLYSREDITNRSWNHISHKPCRCSCHRSAFESSIYIGGRPWFLHLKS